MSRYARNISKTAALRVPGLVAFDAASTSEIFHGKMRHPSFPMLQATEGPKRVCEWASQRAIASKDPRKLLIGKPPLHIYKLLIALRTHCLPQLLQSSPFMQ